MDAFAQGQPVLMCRLTSDDRRWPVSLERSLVAQNSTAPLAAKHWLPEARCFDCDLEPAWFVCSLARLHNVWHHATPRNASPSHMAWHGVGHTQLDSCRRHAATCQARGRSTPCYALHVYIHTQTYINTLYILYIYTHMHTCIYTYIYIYIYTHMHVYTYNHM